ncbi:hypothetical protein K1T71_013086 [Dendrolimus kikuchii]|uniref:Uncharacterized protein n=1 Tax=Dendrolimus kikuchii TaxID=765133 RepID=A0ACC1CJ00_9NEOP|nr:hypothetical protein K1T71_013086 [Dendrolimus kikuchii]
MFDIEEKFKNAIFNLDLSEEETLKELDLESVFQGETEYILLKAHCEKLLCTESHEAREFANANLPSNYKSLDDTQTTGNDNSLKKCLHDDIIEQ